MVQSMLNFDKGIHPKNPVVRIGFYLRWCYLTGTNINFSLPICFPIFLSIANSTAYCKESKQQKSALQLPSVSYADNVAIRTRWLCGVFGCLIFIEPDAQTFH